MRRINRCYVLRKTDQLCGYGRAATGWGEGEEGALDALNLLRGVSDSDPERQFPSRPLPLDASRVKFRSKKLLPSPFVVNGCEISKRNLKWYFIRTRQRK